MATETLDAPKPQPLAPNGDAPTKAEADQHEIQDEEQQHDKEISDDLPEQKNCGQLEENVDREEDAEEDEDEDEEGEKKENDVVTPVKSASGGRPTRERKSVERYTVSSPHKFPGYAATKTISIDQGNGTQLKDIPNVAFKLSKRKVDDNLRSLHSILFGKKAKAHTLKRNIGMFSGYVWAENEEKQRAKVKERLDKCVKEKLIDFCDVLNLQINKSSLKKEELSAKLLEFLESPHATTDVLLADKEKKGKKRAKKKTPRKSSGGAAENPSKKQKQSSKNGKKRKQSSDSEENDTTEPSDATNSSQEDEDDGENVSVPKSESDCEVQESQSDEEENKNTSEKTVNEDHSTPAKKTSPEKVAKSNDKMPKKSTSASKRQKTDGESRESKQKIANENETGKSSKSVSKDQGQGNISKKANAEPTKEDMHAVVVNMLKEVDFNTATLSDILKKLGTHFGLDLMHRKAEVKDIITDVINNMSDEENENGDDEDEDNA
ncbi:hypothetical protein HN51_036747 [Arachis hypogaea]|uniref:protein DEK isoform X2 n=1 Tax=Arachis ipaensis TaxID=130454 RepID=UPI0007AF5712|nr:protein DEK isoform X2 [Arachis ipaensis]XP_025637458.1 protein DEK isoform X2 [Arachis hypogaea]QHO02177.1 Protein DEK [Arachis hypogaea]